MRVSSYTPFPTQPRSTPPGSTPLPEDTPTHQEGASPSHRAFPPFQPFDEQAFTQAQQRNVPVFLLIGEMDEAFSDPALCDQLVSRAVPVHLMPGMRPDVELLCLRTSLLFSEESALPLCALLLPDGRPFLAAPLPPPGYPMDPARLFVWLTQADRRFAQNLPALVDQAAQTLRSFRARPLRRAYSPADAAHNLLRALIAIEDRKFGGFGHIKAPFATALGFLQRASSRGSGDAHALLNRALDAMLASPLHDPLDGAFFRASLTDDWRACIPQKPLGVNALLALILLRSGRRSEAARVLEFILDWLTLPGGLLSPYVGAPVSSYSFTPKQVCAVLGGEEGLRACRLLGLLRHQARALPAITPSRFSPQPDARPPIDYDAPPLSPSLPTTLAPDDAAFLRRMLPKLLRTRASRPQDSAPYWLGEDCALAAYALAVCGRRLGESRYTHAAQRAVSAMLRLAPTAGDMEALPPAYAPGGAPSCGASAALALALLELGRMPEFESYAESGLRILDDTLRAFMGADGSLMYTAHDPAAFFPHVPAIDDSELPSPAATLVRALRLAQKLRPEIDYAHAIDTLWDWAAPYAKASPMSMAGLIDAMNSDI